MENSDPGFLRLNILSQMTSSINFSSSRNVEAVLHFVWLPQAHYNVQHAISLSKTAIFDGAEEIVATLLMFAITWFNIRQYKALGRKMALDTVSRLSLHTVKTRD